MHYPSTVRYEGMLAPPRDVVREQIMALQRAMAPVQGIPPEPEHHFARGMYARALTIPAGMVVVGKHHKHEHFVFVAKGRAVIVSEFGRQEVEAGFIAVSPPGIKRAVYAHEDTMFVTLHLNPTDTQDMVQVEAEHIEPESAEDQALLDAYRKEISQ